MNKFHQKDKRDKGKKFEQQAEEFLISKGYVLVKRNYFYHSCEVDLIMISPERVLVFVEVKFRYCRHQTNFNPWGAVSIKKQKNLFKAATGFLNENPEFNDYFSQYDVIIITSSLQATSKIHHFPDAFRQEVISPSW